MKSLHLTLTILLLLVTTAGFVIAEETNSSNYKILGARVGSGGGETDNTNTGGEYGLLVTVGEIADDRTNSANYSVLPGSPNVLIANTPLVECFETATSGSTSCSDPEINPDGMIMLCGDGGCYDRARFEIDTQNNPVDTLYSAQIKESSDSVWDFVDGTTFLIEDLSTHDINDYLTESAWENTASNFNVLGLTPGRTYDLRLTALDGDFTESIASPIETSTTSIPEISFDIDIDGTGGSTTETSAPNSINLGVLNPSSVTTANDLIWFDLGTNSVNGAVVFIEDNFNGLNSVSNSYTISSNSIDLSTVNEGFGLVEFSSNETYLGPLSVSALFGNGGDIVGAVSTTASNFYNTSGNPISQGRAGIYVKARSNIEVPAASDYEDEITFTIIGSI